MIRHRWHLRGERGETTLPGLVLASVLLVVVLVATLDLFDGFAHAQRGHVERNDAQDRARTALDGLARDLRNLASPSPDQPEAFDLADVDDLVFKTVAPESPGAGQNLTNVRRVRYCVAAGAADGALVEQTQTWTTAAPPPVPPTTACPAAGWATTTTLVDTLVPAPAGPPWAVFATDSTVLTEISSVHASLRLDTDTTDQVPATTLSTGVFLRNQNRAPTAVFTASATSQGILLNGSGSHDPEGQPLRYEWYDGATLVGTGIVYSYAATAGSHSITLKVLDPADLSDVAPAQAVIA